MLRSRDRSQPLVAELLEGDIGRVPLEGDGHRDVELVRRREHLTLSDKRLSQSRRWRRWHEERNQRVSFRDLNRLTLFDRIEGATFMLPQLPNVDPLHLHIVASTMLRKVGVAHCP